MALVDPSMFIFCFCFLFFSMFFKKDSSSLYYFHLFLFSSEQCFCVYFVLLPCFFSSFLKWLFATILFIQKTGVFDDIFNVWFKEHFSCGKETRERSMIELVCQLIEGKISARIRSALLLKWKMPNKMVANQGIHLYWLVFCCCLCFFFCFSFNSSESWRFHVFFFFIESRFQCFHFLTFYNFFSPKFDDPSNADASGPCTIDDQRLDSIRIG